jgi:hypothetical protein
MSLPSSIKGPAFWAWVDAGSLFQKDTILKKLLISSIALALILGGASASAGGSNKVIHRVSLGGADACEALGLPNGCDANFSLVAIQSADGSVKGQWTDIFGTGHGDGVHVDIDCLNVVDNGAAIGGVITKGSFGEDDYTGLRVTTAVIDNGTSSNDVPDQLSFSRIGDDRDCNDLDPFANFRLFILEHGQVKVR